MSLWHIVYTSEATQPVRCETLRAIGSASRSRNAMTGVTGLLLHVRGHFIQLLEGEAVTLANLYSKLQRDPRHRNLRCIYYGCATGRVFPGWSMGVLEADEVASIGSLSEVVELFAAARSPESGTLDYPTTLRAFEAFLTELEAPNEASGAA